MTPTALLSIGDLKRGPAMRKGEEQISISLLGVLSIQANGLRASRMAAVVAVVVIALMATIQL
jgi:hypothetical protein